MFMLSILQSLTCVWLYFGGQNSVRKKEVTKKNSGSDMGDFTSQMYVFECVDN